MWSEDIYECWEQPAPDVPKKPRGATVIWVPDVPRDRPPWWKLFARNVVQIVLILAVVYLLLGLLYRGPQDMRRVKAVMRGVPIFPNSTIASGNARTQRALAIPLCVVRLQGVKHTEAALVQAAADRESVLDWYKTMAPRHAWTLIDQELLAKGTRLLFTRNHAAFQIIIGATRDINTPVQLIYLDGITERQRQLLIENPNSAAERAG